MFVRRSTKFAFKSKVHVAANRLHSALRSRRCLLLEDGHSFLTFESLTRRLRGSPLDRSIILKFRRIGLAGVSQMIFSDSTDSHALVCARSEIAVLAGASHLAAVQLGRRDWTPPPGWIANCACTRFPCLMYANAITNQHW